MEIPQAGLLGYSCKKKKRYYFQTFSAAAKGIGY